MAVTPGTVTFLFSDIEGSTRLLAAAAGLPELLERHRRCCARRSSARRAGARTEGDAFFVAFASAAAMPSRRQRTPSARSRHDWPDGDAIRVRMGVHTGEPRRRRATSASTSTGRPA